MSVYDTLRRAISARRCVRVLAAGRARDICPYALGKWRGKPRLLAFQYAGGSASGLAASGEWRSFFLEEIAVATPIDGAWHIGHSHNLVAKIEATLDHIDCRAPH